MAKSRLGLRVAPLRGLRVAAALSQASKAAAVSHVTAPPPRTARSLLGPAWGPSVRAPPAGLESGGN
eukprot:7327419-Pyramimonas_sp.AAC.1